VEVPAEQDALAAYYGKDVVLDTAGPLVYIGRLLSVDSHFFTLSDVDVHDMNDGHAPKEKYILDALKFGIKKNRARVLVRRGEVLSLSLLEDVISY
jgi:hypothetical protein